MYREKHRSFNAWLTLVVFAVVASNVVMLWGPEATGYVVFDTGPTADLNPDFIEAQDYYSHATTSLVFVLAIIGIQALIYLFVTRLYKNVD